MSDEELKKLVRELVKSIKRSLSRREFVDLVQIPVQSMQRGSVLLQHF